MKFESKNIVWMLVYIAGWIVIFNLPAEIFHQGDGASRWIPFLCIFILLPIIFYKSIENLNYQKSILQAIALSTVFLGIPFGIYLGERADNEITEYRRSTIGVINKAWLDKSGGSEVWHVRATYQVDGESYSTSTKENRDKTLLLNDTVTIIYSEKTPQMSEIQEIE